MTRYVQDYRRILACLKAGMSVEQSAYAAGMSVRLAQEYRSLIEKHGESYQRKEQDGPEIPIF